MYDRDNIAFSFNGSGNQTDRYLYGPYVDQVLVDEKAINNLLWTLPDHQGTMRDLANSTGSVPNHIRYGSFGNVTSQTNSAVATRYGYTGRELDSESGNYNYRARYLRPATGRFISPDPIGFNAGDANLYRYVGNSPLNATDPSGKRDVRAPFNGSVTNQSRDPVYPVISNEEGDSYEILYPNQSTPDAIGRSKDVDGVWTYRNGRWLFYPNFVSLGPWGSGGLIVKCDGVYDEQGKMVPPWNPLKPDENPDSSPAKRASSASLTPPDLNRKYPSATNWYPVRAGKDTDEPINLLQNGIERAYNAVNDTLNNAVRNGNNTINNILKKNHIDNAINDTINNAVRSGNKTINNIRRKLNI